MERHQTEITKSDWANHPAYKRARQIIEQSWLDQGVTREELDHGEIVMDLLDRWLAEGHAMDDFIAPPLRQLTAKA